MTSKKTKKSKEIINKSKSITFEDMIKKENDNPITKEEMENRDKKLKKKERQFSKTIPDIHISGISGLPLKDIDSLLANVEKEAEKTNKVIVKAAEDYRLTYKHLDLWVDEVENSIMYLSSAVSNYEIPKFYENKLNQILNSNYSEQLKREFNKLLSSDINYVTKASHDFKEQYNKIIDTLPNQIELLGLDSSQIDFSIINNSLEQNNPFNYLNSNQLLNTSLIDIEHLTSISLLDYEDDLNRVFQSLNIPATLQYSDLIDGLLFSKKFAETKILNKLKKETTKSKSKLIQESNKNLRVQIQSKLNELEHNQSDQQSHEMLTKILKSINELEKSNSLSENLSDENKNRIRKHKNISYYIEILAVYYNKHNKYPKPRYVYVKNEIISEHQKYIKNKKYINNPQYTLETLKYKNRGVIKKVTETGFTKVGAKKETSWKSLNSILSQNKNKIQTEIKKSLVQELKL